MTLPEKGSSKGPLVHENGHSMGAEALLGPHGRATRLTQGRTPLATHWSEEDTPWWALMCAAFVPCARGRRAAEGWLALGCVALMGPLMCPLIGPCGSIGPAVAGWGGLLS